LRCLRLGWILKKDYFGELETPKENEKGPTISYAGRNKT